MDLDLHVSWAIVPAVLLTLFTGTMQALKQEQSKRLLAFHSIGQVGYILLALGASLPFLRFAANPVIEDYRIEKAEG